MGISKQSANRVKRNLIGVIVYLARPTTHLLSSLPKALTRTPEAVNPDPFSKGLVFGAYVSQYAHQRPEPIGKADRTNRTTCMTNLGF